MDVANLAAVKNDLSRYVARVRQGGRVRILLRGVPVADLVPVESVSGDAGADDLQLSALEKLGLVRRGKATSSHDRAGIERPGPRVRGGKAVETLLSERRSGR